MVHLMAGGIDVESARQSARQELCEMLDRLDGPKALVIDATISGPLGMIAEMTMLRAHGVEKTCHLKPEPLAVSQRRVVYLVRANIANMKMIAEQMREQSAEKHQNLEYFVCLVPRSTIMCERVLEEEGVYGDLVISELDFGLIPIEDDLMSMESPDLYRECEFLGDKTGLFYCAKSLMRLQILYGTIRNVRGKGDLAKQVADFLLVLREELGDDDEQGSAQEIDELILVDRETDLLTLMLTPNTYEGLIDDFYGMNHGVVALPGGVVLGAQGKFVTEEDKKARIKVPITSKNDNLFTQIRDVGISQVKGRLDIKEANFRGMSEDDQRRFKLHHALEKELQESVLESSFSRKLDVEMLILQGKMSQEKALDYIDEALYTNQPFTKVMRLLCLVSLVFDGIRKHDFYSGELIQVYGVQVMFALKSLERGGLWKKKTEGGVMGAITRIKPSTTNSVGSQWETVKKALNLMVVDEGKELDVSDPDCVSYIYGGYVPISVRIIEKAMYTPHDKWMSLAPNLKGCPGEMFAFTQKNSLGRARDCKTILVFFVGAVVPAEVSGIRFLVGKHNKYLKEDEKPLRVLICTTQFAGADSVMSSLANIPVNTVRSAAIAADKARNALKKGV